MIHTTLAKARGVGRNVITRSERLRWMQPISVDQVKGDDLMRAAYLREIAEFQAASGMLFEARTTLCGALGFACRGRWIAISQRHSTSITEPERFLQKLRSSTFLGKSDYLLLLRLLAKTERVNIFDLERMSQAVFAVIYDNDPSGSA